MNDDGDWLCWAGCLAVLVLSVEIGHAEKRFALIVSGASGGPPYADSYDAWRHAIVLALRDKYGFPERQIHALGERPGANTALASRDNVEAAIDVLTEQVTAGGSLARRAHWARHIRWDRCQVQPGRPRS